MTKNKTKKTTFPTYAKVPINHCNLPVEVLGDVSFQTNPKPLYIDGVAQLHHELFELLDTEVNADVRCLYFMQHMSAHFQLEHLEEAGYQLAMSVDRSKANFLRILRGWFFNSDSVEGAVIKSWVESRFGLVPRYHQGSIHSVEDETYAQFAAQRSRGLYNTNALEAQLDLLYSYCQYELSRRYPTDSSILLFRGQNHLQSLEQPAVDITGNELKSPVMVLLNNISSFTSDPARAGEFGDIVIRTEVPFAKLLFFSGMMPGIMTSEREYAVIGGVYNVNVVWEIND